MNVIARDGTELPPSVLPQGLARLYLRPRIRDIVVRHFQALYYARLPDTVFGATWLGVPVVKYPTDAWAYQELLARVRPDLVVETGTHRGGSAVFLASVCELLGSGRVLSIDIGHAYPLPEHPRVEFVVGSSTAPEIVERVRREAAAAERVLVILDSDHSRDHVLDELRAYAPLVTPGSYAIVEDSNINGHPVLPGYGPGPMEAIDAFLAETDLFAIDPDPERYLLTANPRGYLRRHE